MSANDDLFDLALQYQIDQRRYANREVAEVLAILLASDRELAVLLRATLRGINTSSGPAQRKLLNKLIEKIEDLRSAAIRRAEARTVEGLAKQVAVELSAELSALSLSLPIEFNFAKPALVQVRAAALTKPFGDGNAAGALHNWFSRLGTADQERIRASLEASVLAGDSVDDAVRRIVGTRAAGFGDGVTARARINAEAVVRSGIATISNEAREAVWQENADIIQGLRWTSTLDGRTTPICRSRDGKIVWKADGKLPNGFSRLQPQDARPPAHVNCRSVMIAFFDIDGLADVLPIRGFETDTRGRRTREIDFRKRAKLKAGDAGWRALTKAERSALIRRERGIWAVENVGTVPGITTYQEWLSRQNPKFQDHVLGKTKADLFRKGGLTLDQFVSRRGDALTLDQLRKRYPNAFERAGLA